MDSLNDETNSINERIDEFDFYNRLYSGSSTLTNLMSSFSSPCIGMCTTEDISDKPSGKYGVILIIKANNNRIGAICFCTDGTTYTNNYNASTSSLNGWIQI